MTSRTALPFLIAFDDVEPGADYQLFSASQIDTFLDCRRKWAWDKIARIPRPANGAASLGDRVHHQLETVLDGGSFDFTEVVNGAKVADIAASSLHLLPSPCCPAPEGETPAEKRARHAAHGMAIEGSFRWQSSSTHFVYTGRKDLELDDSGCIPGLAEEYGLEVDSQGRTGVPAVLDHKSTSSLRWAKTSEDLEWDVQANLYAYDLAATRGAQVVDLVWNYMQTRGGKSAKRTHLRVTREQAVHKFGLIQDVARDMATIKRRAPKFDNSPDILTDAGDCGPPDIGDEWRGELAAFVEGITPNGAACEKFGGCSYRHVCRLTPAEGAFSFMSSNPNELFDSLRKRAAAQDGVKPAELPPTCAPEDVPAPAEVPAWAVNGDPPVSLKKSAPAVVPPSINPPESTLPPPALPPAPAAPPPVSPSADTAEKSASDDTKPKRGPGRPRKNAASKDPTGADAAMHTGMPPAPIATVDTLSDEAAQAAVDRAVAHCGDAPVVTNTSGKFFLFVDCIPISGGYENVDTYIAQARATIAATEFTDAKGNPVRYADYRFIPFGQGPGALAIAVEQAVDEAQPSGLFLSTATPEGCAVLATLSSKASLVVRGLR